MNVLEILAESVTPMAPQDIMKRIERPDLVYILLEKLESHGLVYPDKNGAYYQLSAEGRRHIEEMSIQRRISSFPPPPIFWPPVR